MKCFTCEKDKESARVRSIGTYTEEGKLKYDSTKPICDDCYKDTNHGCQPEILA